jgi:type I restriction enzyme M protein
VALHCGHDRRGRSHLSNGERQLDDFPSIAKAFHDETTAGGYWRSTPLEGQRYLVPRYYYDQEEVGAAELEVTRGARFATLGELVKEKVISIRKGHEVGSDA